MAIERDRFDEVTPAPAAPKPPRAKSAQRATKVLAYLAARPGVWCYTSSIRDAVEPTSTQRAVAGLCRLLASEGKAEMSGGGMMWRAIADSGEEQKR
jgi:hypothetical protein